MKRAVHFFAISLILLALTACTSESGDYALEDFELEKVEVREFNREFNYDELRTKWLASWSFSDADRLERTLTGDFARLSLSDEGLYDFIAFIRIFLENNSEYDDKFTEQAWIWNTPVVPNSFLSWLDFITPTQFAIVKEYMGIPKGAFEDQIFDDYIGNVILGGRWNPDILRYYDDMPFDENTYNPRRILVRMYEAFLLVSIEFRMANPITQTSEHEMRNSTFFGES